MAITETRVVARARRAADGLASEFDRPHVGLMLTLPFAALWVLSWVPLIARMLGPEHFVGADYHLYLAAAARYLNGDGFYSAFQLAGPYFVGSAPILYPPEMLTILIPFIVAPAVLWWVVPLAILAAVIAWHRPRPIVWPLLAACLWWPETTLKVLTGNPGLWTAAFVALGTMRPSLFALALLKPSLFPFAMLGITTRTWWALAVVAFVPFSWLLGTYLAALANFASPEGAFYSLAEVPLPGIAVVAWIGSRRHPPRFDSVRRAADLLVRTGRAAPQQQVPNATP